MQYTSKLSVHVRRNVETVVSAYPTRDVSWDSASRGYLRDEARATCCASIRAPSRNWPFSQARHGLSSRHRRQWALEQIECALSQIGAAASAALGEQVEQAAA